MDTVFKTSEQAVIIVLGCRTRYKKLLNTLKRLREQRHGYQVIGIVGKNNGPDWAIKTNRTNGIITVPCRDTYEALPEKVLWTCLAISMLNSNLAIIKDIFSTLWTVPGLEERKSIHTCSENKSHIAVHFPMLDASHFERIIFGIILLKVEKSYWQTAWGISVTLEQLAHHRVDIIEISSNFGIVYELKQKLAFFKLVF